MNAKNAGIRKGTRMESSYKIISYKASAMPKSYWNMVLSKWLRSLRFGCDYMRIIDKDIYFKGYQIYIEQIFKRPEATIRLAVLSDDEDVVLGWAVYEGPRLHYIYVNRDFRKAGIGTALYSKDTEEISHVTTIGMSIWASKKPHLKFNPF